MAASRGRTIQSAMPRNAMASTLASGAASGCAVSPISMISPMIEEIGWICAVTPAGRESRAAASRSAACWRAATTSAPQSSSTVTIESPTADEERSRSVAGSPASARSSGTVTRASTSSEARPPASVITTSAGRLTSGSTSMSSRRAANSPSSIRRTVPAITGTRWTRLARTIAPTIEGRMR